MALTELARFLPRSNHHNRYLRSGMRTHHREDNLDASHAEQPQQQPEPPPPSGSDEPA